MVEKQDIRMGSFLTQCVRFWYKLASQSSPHMMHITKSTATEKIQEVNFMDLLQSAFQLHKCRRKYRGVSGSVHWKKKLCSRR